MIVNVHIYNIGPHADATFTFDGKTPARLVGRSDAGKNWFMEAVAFGFFGTTSTGSAFPAEAIRTGTKKCGVEITLNSGTIIRRSMTSRRAQNRTIVRNGEESPHSDEDSFRAAMGPLGKNQDLLRFVMFPQERYFPVWFGGNDASTRKCRDIMLSAMPGMDIASVVVEEMKKAGHSISADKVPSVKDAEASATTANRIVDEKTGAKSAAETSKSDAENALKNAESSDTDEAKADRVAAELVIKARDAWLAHDARMATHNAVVENVGVNVKTRNDWLKRKEAIGAEPDAEAAKKLAAKRAELPAAESAVKAANDEWARIKRLIANNEGTIETERASVWSGNAIIDTRIGYAKKELASAKKTRDGAIAAGTSCPTCGKPDYEGAVKAREAAEKAVRDAETSLHQSEDDLLADERQWEDDRKKHIEECETIIAKQKVELAALVVKGTEASNALKALKAEIATLDEQASAWTTWAASVKALGDEPSIPSNASAAPEAPECERPDNASIEKAKSILAVQAPNLDALRQSVATATKRLEEAEKALDEANTKASYAEALKVATRTAPSILGNRMVSVFKDIGGFATVAFGEKPSVALVIDGLPWELVGGGRKIAADFAIRAMLREKMKMGYLPLFVNDRVLWTGDIPRKGPVIELVTDKGSDIHVEQ